MEETTNTVPMRESEEDVSAQALDEVISAFDTSVDELSMRQDNDGVLYIRDGPTPTMVARVELESNDYTAAVADPEDVELNWMDLEPIHSIGDETRVQD